MNITQRTGTYGTETGDLHIFEITDEQGIASAIYIDPATHIIANVETRADRQGEGLARAVYEAADAALGVYHMPEWGCTREGWAFVEAVGGDIIDDETAAAFAGINLEVLGL